MGKTKKIGLLLLISLFLALIICLVSLNQYFDKMMRISKSEMENGESFTYTIQHESNPLDKNIKDFKELYDALLENQKSDYIYYEIYLQYLENSNENGMFYSEETEELESPCNGIRCIQISENVIKDFDINVSEGKIFGPEDYIYDGKSEIPILMGSAYNTIYKLGDTFKWNYLFDEYEFEVIGFLDEGSKIDIGQHNMLLDKYVVMPSFLITAQVSITDGLKIHYANKTSGIVKLLDCEANVFHTVVEPLLENTELGTYTWTARPMELQFKEILGINISTIQKIIWLSNIILVLGEIVFLYVFAKYGWAGKNHSRLKSILYMLIIFGITSAMYLLINCILIIRLGIVVVKGIHFLIIGMLSCGSIFLSVQFHLKTIKNHPDG